MKTALLPVRALAAQITAAVISSGKSLTTALSSFLPQLKNDHERSLLKELCFGTIRWQPRLHIASQQLIKIPLKAKDSDIQALILIGLYQLMYLRVPQHAAVSETVAAAYALKKPWAAKLINGVLRQYLRTVTELLAKIDNNPIAHYAHPGWLIETMQSAWPDHWQSILQANNEHPPLSCRINAQQYQRDDYCKLLAEENIAVTPIQYTTHGIIISSPLDVHLLPGFSAGAISVQDGAAQFAAELLELKPQLRVLDACAAPGGKTAAILESEPQLAKVIAVDVDAQRMMQVKENCIRLKLTAECVVGDASQPETWWDKQLFDRILCDAPCSATGIIRRHPDIKLLRRETDIAELNQLQWKILTALWALLKSGGLLLYATCSILPAENCDLMKKFLSEHNDAKEELIQANWGIAQTVGRQILPGMDQLDGFYYAKLRKF